MKTIKTILFYLIYTIISILFCVCYKYMELGKRPNSEFIVGIHNYIIIVFGTILGVISAIFFFLIHHFAIKDKINNPKKIILIQLITLAIIIFLVNKLHYFLEFDLDII